jgi:hypothetical protein
LSCVVTLGRKKLPGLGALTYAMFSLQSEKLKLLETRFKKMRQKPVNQRKKEKNKRSTLYD